MSEESVDTHISRDDLSALLEVSIALAESLDQDAVWQIAVDAAVRILGADTGALYLIEGGDAVLAATTQPLAHPVADELRRLSLSTHALMRQAIETREPAIIPDTATVELRADTRMAFDVRDIRSTMYVPLIARGTAEGVIVVATCERIAERTDHDMDLCRMLAGQIALAIQNARLFDAAQATAAELRTAYDATLEGWSLAIETRHDQTPGHTQRAADLACEIAQRLGISETDIPHVRRGALLHDIGTMAVPDAILNKPGPLDDDEWAVIRSHPVIARDFLSRVGYLSPALDIPYYHHERWDGTGYPSGLRGTRIPLAARIYAVVDVYDALTSERPFRRAWSPQQAMSHILGHAGTHFDPVVVAAFAERVDAAAQRN